MGIVKNISSNTGQSTNHNLYFRCSDLFEVKYKIFDRETVLLPSDLTTSKPLVVIVSKLKREKFILIKPNRATEYGH